MDSNGDGENQLDDFVTFITQKSCFRVELIRSKKQADSLYNLPV